MSPFRASVLRRSASVAIVAVGIVAGFGVAFAQNGSARGASAPPVELSERREVKLSLPEMEKKASAIGKSINKGATVVSRRLRKARDAKDVVKKLCLDDKLTEINTAKASAEGRAGSLSLAVKRGDKERARLHFMVLEVLGDRVQALVAESAQCVGEEVGEIGESTVTFTADPNLPQQTETDLSSATTGAGNTSVDPDSGTAAPNTPPQEPVVSEPVVSTPTPVSPIGQ